MVPPALSWSTMYGCTPPLHPSPRVQALAIRYIVGCGRTCGRTRDWGACGVVWCGVSRLSRVCCEIRFGGFVDEYSGTLFKFEGIRVPAYLCPFGTYT